MGVRRLPRDYLLRRRSRDDTATLLPSGKVLIAGGGQLLTSTSTADLFDPATGTFTPVPATMTSERYVHAAALLPGGKVLLSGGDTGSNTSGPTTSTAEVFDPASTSFTSLLPNTMSLGRQGHTATPLPNGKVLIAGGSTGDGITTGENTDTAELFDPASGTFTPVPSTMSSRRNWHTATLLPTGKVLIFGFAYRDTAELFDPASGTFTTVPGTMSFARARHTATLLANGKVLIAGGWGSFGSSLTTDTAELFDPATGTFTSLPRMTSPRDSHTATLLPSGQVLITGGNTGTRFTNEAELFDPATETFTLLSNTMVSERYFHKATLLPNGTVLITGGGNLLQGKIGNTAELFDPATGTFRSLPPMTAVRYFDTATLLTSGKVLITGGPGEVSGNSNTAELFDTGLGFPDARRPVLSTVPDPLVQPASLVLTGTGFRGDSEGSESSFSSSATNYPLVQLMRVDGGQILFPLSDPATNWSDTTFSSETLGAVAPLPAGHYRVTVYTNAIPSLQKIIYIDLPECDPERLGGPLPGCENVGGSSHA